MLIGKSSEAKLKAVHPDLARVVRRVAESLIDPALGFIITCGARTLDEQKILLAKGASRTLRSRHIPGRNGFSHAVDFAVTLNGAVRWDWPLYVNLAKAVKLAARQEDVPVEWGGNWAKFRDGPHFQLPWNTYPS